MQTTLPIVIDQHELKPYGSAKQIRCAKLSKCTDYVVLIDEFRRVYVHRVSTNDSWPVPVKGGAIAVAMSTGTEFAVASEVGTIQRFDMTMPKICLSKFSSKSVRCLAYDPTGTMIVTGSENGEVRLFGLEADTPYLIGEAKKISDSAIVLIAVRKDTVIGVNKSGRICALSSIETEPRTAIYGKETFDLDSWALAQHPYLNCFVVGGAGSYIRYFSQYNLLPQIFPSSFKFVRDLVFLDFLDDSCTRFAAAGPSGVEIWNVTTNSVQIHAAFEGKRVLCVGATADRLKVIYG